MDDLLEDRLKPCAADGGGPGLVAAEAELELLTDLLQTQNFRRLRADQPHLAGGHPITIEITRAPDGRVTIEAPDHDPLTG